MKKRAIAWAALIGVAGLAACSDTPAAPVVEPPPDDGLTAAAIALYAVDAVPFSEERLSDLSASMEDLHTRIAPTLDDSEPSAALRDILGRFEGSVTVWNPRATVVRVTGALSTLDLLALREDFVAFVPELDAIRLALTELRGSAAAELQKQGTFK